MIVYIQKWLEFAYLFTIKNKTIYYGKYTPSIFDEEESSNIIIKECKNPNDYKDNKNIILIVVNKDKNSIDVEELIKKICFEFSYNYEKKILNYILKKKTCPLLFIYNLSIGNCWPKENNKILVPMNTTITTLKYIQSMIWYFYLDKRYTRVFKEYSLDKTIYISSTLINLEKEFSYISNVPEIFMMPLLKFH